MAKKEEVINKYGQRIRMNEAARRIAERHFGINKPRPVIKEVPQELLQLPKRIDITKAIETIEVPKVTPVKIVAVKPVEIYHSAEIEKVLEPEVKAPVKKPARKPVKKSK